MGFCIFSVKPNKKSLATEPLLPALIWFVGRKNTLPISKIRIVRYYLKTFTIDNGSKFSPLSELENDDDDDHVFYYFENDFNFRKYFKATGIDNKA